MPGCGVLKAGEKIGGRISLPECGVLKAKVDKAAEHLRNCRLCPHLCGVDRATSSGYCEAPDRAVVSSVMPHFGEESVLVGRRGSGTIFFGHCNLRCVFCQNYELSFYGEGEEVSDEQLAASMLLLQNRYGCHNVNLVTPTHFVPNILSAYHLARQGGLDIPLVYNCGGYECVETLKLLEGVVGIYMPDFKYLDPDAAEKYSGARDYPDVVKAALREMDRQVGGLVVDGRGVAVRGLLIRHLMLPGQLEDTMRILDFIAEELSPDCLVNLMEQYYPAHRASDYPELRTRVRRDDYRKARKYAVELGLRLA